MIFFFFFYILAHFQTWGWLDSLLPLRRLQISSAVLVTCLCGHVFSASSPLQTKPFSSDSFEFLSQNFNLCSCGVRHDLTCAPAVCLATYDRPQTLPGARSTTWPVCKHTAQSHGTLKPHNWPLCKFWVLCWERCVTAALREERRLSMQKKDMLKRFILLLPGTRECQISCMQEAFERFTKFPSLAFVFMWSLLIFFPHLMQLNLVCEIEGENSTVRMEVQEFYTP